MHWKELQIGILSQKKMALKMMPKMQVFGQKQRKRQVTALEMKKAPEHRVLPVLEMGTQSPLGKSAKGLEPSEGIDFGGSLSCCG